MHTSTIYSKHKTHACTQNKKVKLIHITDYKATNNNFHDLWISCHIHVPVHVYLRYRCTCVYKVSITIINRSA